MSAIRKLMPEFSKNVEGHTVATVVDREAFKALWQACDKLWAEKMEVASIKNYEAQCRATITFCKGVTEEEAEDILSTVSYKVN